MNEYKCKICNSTQSDYSFTKTILSKHKVEYSRCANCGFLQTESPYWLNEAYSNAIAKLDVGIIYRTLHLYPAVAALIDFLFKGEKYIDYGGGYGIFTRIMRDNGYDYYNYDPMCENIFSQAFNVNGNDTTRYDLLTAFEVFEHLENPVEDVEKMFQYSDSILFTTELQPPKNIESWWYLVPETGQHISFYTTKSLAELAKRTNSSVYSKGNIHVMSRKQVNGFLFNLITSSGVKGLLRMRSSMSKKSLLQKDFEKIRNANTV
jgi:2-polyprenyl-3-methyl-5-hydroxy-6-metoxy-1,4-benzoquinol methylase